MHVVWLLVAPPHLELVVLLVVLVVLLVAPRGEAPAADVVVVVAVGIAISVCGELGLKSNNSNCRRNNQGKPMTPLMGVEDISFPIRFIASGFVCMCSMMYACPRPYKQRIAVCSVQLSAHACMVHLFCVCMLFCVFYTFFCAMRAVHVVYVIFCVACCVNVLMCVCERACVWMCARVRVCVRECAYVDACVCVCGCMCVCARYLRFFKSI